MGNGSGPFGPEGQASGAHLRVQPNIARVYDALLGGKDSFVADRDLAARLVEVQPLIVAGARANRAFLCRAVGFLARQGISQFLDLGCGLPTARNVHQIAGRVNPAARTVYLDNDPIVLAYARALLAYARALLADGDRTTVADGDLRDPKAILADPGVRGHLDFTRPVAVIMAAVLHFITDQEDPAGIVAAFRDVMAPGSALVITHVVDGDADDGNGNGNADSDGDGNADGHNVSAATRKSAQLYSETTSPFTLRTHEQVAAWFDGMRLLPPGLVNAGAWRRTGNRKTTAPILAGVGLLDPQARRPESRPPGSGAPQP
ncbi:MAG TPA: SAM-dependent methyltransferase [Kineosporiaceae bacterium]|nr:SAM-dependent methyltransferase [Kineosporiaceae bacterium]